MRENYRFLLSQISKKKLIYRKEIEYPAVLLIHHDDRFHIPRATGPHYSSLAHLLQHAYVGSWGDPVLWSSYEFEQLNVRLRGRNKSVSGTVSKS